MTNAREAVHQCRANLNKANSLSEQQRLAGVCEQMEDDFRQAYGTAP